MERNIKYHKKLIRDKIPEIIKGNGGEYEIREMNDTEFGIQLRKKLIEEAHEVENANQEELLGELADVMEVVHGLAVSCGMTIEQVEEKRISKKEKRGGFDKKLFLEWSSEEN